jgi:hypothetical protein
MWEYHVPVEEHIRVDESPEILFDLTVGALGDLTATINGEAYFSQEDIPGLRASARFAARFFDAFRASRLNESQDSFVTLCASACYYLCDMPGSSAVLASQLTTRDLDLDAGGLERLLHCLLAWDMQRPPAGLHSRYQDVSSQLHDQYSIFRSTGRQEQTILSLADLLRDAAYRSGGAQELLFADAVSAVIRRRIDCSAWECLPRFSKMPADAWRESIGKPTFMRELWPAQRLLGEQGVLAGASAIVQMPTSAGKTRATELIIRSAFLSGRASLAVIVAPYRALCHEIHDGLARAFLGEAVAIDELSDVLQYDFQSAIEIIATQKQVLVVTPEKLHYVLRHEPTLAGNIGLVIYDEGHLFDDPTRGVNYELLLTSVKGRLPPAAQTILLSAVIRNATQICRWLLGQGGIVVSGAQMLPTERSVGFTSWTTVRGQLQFAAVPEVQEYAFFVPRVLEEQQLEMRPREKSHRIFPEKDDANDIALYLGLKLSPNGGVAIFCGRKDTAVGICSRAAEVYSRGVPIPPPREFSDVGEIQRLHTLHTRHLGPDSPGTQCAALGILSHHGNTPHGVRLAVEHALQRGMAKCVVCTSTLAQGVNLPIRYLIISSVYQGRERIKARDFHNLIGRAGRAGKHTEGSIIFADPRIYDERLTRKESWRWQQALTLLDPANSEDCVSAIAYILRPILSDDGRRQIDTKPLYLAQVFVGNPEKFLPLADTIAERHPGFSADLVRAQLLSKLTAIRAIQSYLLAHSEALEEPSDAANGLVEGTLAYSLADETGKDILRQLFRLVADNIAESVPQVPKRRVYGRTLLGLRDCLEIDEWEGRNIVQLEAQEDAEGLMEVLWPLLTRFVQHAIFRKCIPREAVEQVAYEWLDGISFGQMFADHLASARIGEGPRARHFKVDHVVDLCENGLGYDGVLVVGAVAELLELREGDHSLAKDRLAWLQKRLKYGLSSEVAVILFELGFADRVLAEELASLVRESPASKRYVMAALLHRREAVLSILRGYPAYFRSKGETILGR